MALIVLAHPNYDFSLANKTIISEIQKNNTSIEIRNIHQLYPDYQINAKAEQEALLRHNTVVFQFPLYWYNVPAILKLWLDEVFSYQFAYGSSGDKLKNKKLLISTTIGQPETVYLRPTEAAPFTDKFFEGIRYSANYAQMDYRGSICTYGLASVLNYTEEERLEKAVQHANKLQEKLNFLENLNQYKI